jgi:hypothetical protein
VWISTYKPCEYATDRICIRLRKIAKGASKNLLTATRAPPGDPDSHLTVDGPLEEADDQTIEILNSGAVIRD